MYKLQGELDFTGLEAVLPCPARNAVLAAKRPKSGCKKYHAFFYTFLFDKSAHETRNPLRSLACKGFFVFDKFLEFFFGAEFFFSSGLFALHRDLLTEKRNACFHEPSNRE